MPPAAAESRPGGDALFGLGRRLSHNLAVQSGTQALGLVLSVIATGVLSRELSVQAFGGFGYMFAFVYFFQAASDLGITTVLTRQVSQTPERTTHLVQSALALKLLMGLAALLLAWAAALALDLEPGTRAAVLLFALILPIQALTLPFVVVKARMLFRRAALAEIANRLTAFGLMLAAVYGGFGLAGVTVALLAAELVGLAAIVAITLEFVRPVPVIDTAAWRSLLAASLTVGGVSVLSTLINRIDFLMLERMAVPEELGYYTAAYRLPNLLERLPLLAMATIYPMMSRLAAADPQELRRLYRWSLTRALWAVVPMLVGVTWFAPGILGLWLGAGFAPAVPSLRLLVWSTALMYVFLPALNVLIALDKVHGAMLAWLVATMVNVALNWWWIPRYGAPGAAAATVASFAIVMVLALALAERALANDA